jgi:hypothetical protein
MTRDMRDMMKSLRGMVLFLCICFVVTMGAGCYEHAETGRVVIKTTGGEMLAEYENVKLIWTMDDKVKIKFTDESETAFLIPVGVAIRVYQPEYKPVFNQLSR